MVTGETNNLSVIIINRSLWPVEKTVVLYLDYFRRFEILLNFYIALCF